MTDDRSISDTLRPAARRVRPGRTHVARALMLGLCIWASSPSRAETIEDWQRAAAEMVDELSDCEAYYAFVKECASRSNTDLGRSTAAGASQSFDAANRLAFLLGQTAKMSNEALLATLQLSIDKIKSEADNGCQNIAVLLVKRGKHCKYIVERPQDELLKRATR